MAKRNLDKLKAPTVQKRAYIGRQFGSAVRQESAKQAPGDGMEEEPVPEIPEKGGSVLRILHNKTLSTHRK